MGGSNGRACSSRCCLQQDDNVECTPSSKVINHNEEQVVKAIGSNVVVSKVPSAEDLTEDPRKSLARFFRDGDSRGPRGCLLQQAEQQHTPKSPGICDSLLTKCIDNEPVRTDWFAVFRPCSNDAISKMVRGSGCGKGLNIKGKSAKQGELSGFVPFLQISDNAHKAGISTPSKASRLQVFYERRETRDEASAKLHEVLQDMQKQAAEGQKALDERNARIRTLSDEEESEAFSRLMFIMDNPIITPLDDCDQFGLDLPERLFQQAYIHRQDLTPIPGWETGRQSTPAFCNMNLHALRESSCGSNELVPHTALLQYSAEDAMNPQGLLLSYVRNGKVCPVVSDFDCFLLGSRGMAFEPIVPDQQQLMSWCLTHTEGILKCPGKAAWSNRWLDVLKRESEKGFHPEIPPYGFGDPTSYAIVQRLCLDSIKHGSVRHGAECFNFYFPQELDAEYLIISESDFGKEVPWTYVSEVELRTYLSDRIAEGFIFPINPVWAVRDAGWFELFQLMRKDEISRNQLSSWYPPESGILHEVDRIHEAFPNGFAVLVEPGMSCDDTAEDSANLGLHDLHRHMTLRRAKMKMRAFLMISRLRRPDVLALSPH